MEYLLNASDEQAVKEGCYFDPMSADLAVKFIEKYVKPSTLGKVIVLLPWQRDLVRRMFGWKRADGLPRYKRTTCSTAKKSGKTVLVSAILAYGLLGNLCPSPFVASASTSRENAGQVYRELAYTIRHDPKLMLACKCLDSMKEIRAKSKQSRYRAFSADAGSSEGENLSLCVCDETHAHVSDRLYRSLEYSTIARPQGMFCNISTAGHDQGHFWYEIFKYAQSVQNSDIIDTSLLPVIFSIPETADIEDPKNWLLANPSLGISFSEDDFRRDFERAKAGGSADLLSFRRYRLNQWCRADDSFIDPIKWDRGAAAIPVLTSLPLFVGVDLSQTTDPCSVSCCFPLGDRKFYIQSHSWVCEEAVKKRELSNLPKYRAFEADGTLTITPGQKNDYRLIKAYIMGLVRKYNLKEVIFDQYNAMEMAAEFQAENITVMRQPQNHKYYTAPCKEFDVAVTEERIKHDGKNKMLRWALANTRLDYDAYGNCRPCRDKSTDKIDPAISTLMAFARALETSVSTRVSRYEQGGLTFI